MLKYDSFRPVSKYNLFPRHLNYHKKVLYFLFLSYIRKVSSPAKIQKLVREIKSKFKKASDEINLMMAIKMERKLIKKD